MGENVDAVEHERLITGYSGRLLVAISAGWGTVQAGRLVISPMLPTISTDLGMSSTAAGIAISVLWGLYALMQYPSGRWSDQLSRKTLLIVGLGLLSAGFLLLAAAPTYLAFLFGAVVVGLGAGLYPTPARGLLSDLFVERRGQAFGVHTATGDLGGVMAAGLASAVLAVAVWRAAFLPIVVVLVGVGLALHLWSREAYVLSSVELSIGATGRRLLAEPKMRWLLAAYVLFAFTWQAAVAFLPTFLQIGKGFPAIVGTAAFAMLFVVGVVVKPTAGWLGDRLPRRFLALGSMGLAAVMLGATVLSPDPLLSIITVAGFSVGLMAFPPVMQAYLMDTFPTESMGGDLGAMRTVYVGLGAIGPTYVGVTAELLDYTTAFAGLVACLLASGVLILVATD